MATTTRQLRKNIVYDDDCQVGKHIRAEESLQGQYPQYT